MKISDNTKNILAAALLKKLQDYFVMQEQNDGSDPRLTGYNDVIGDIDQRTLNDAERDQLGDMIVDAMYQLLPDEIMI